MALFLGTVSGVDTIEEDAGPDSPPTHGNYAAATGACIQLLIPRLADPA